MAIDFDAFRESVGVARKQPKNTDKVDFDAYREKFGLPTSKEREKSQETYSNSTEEERIQEKLDRVLSKDRQTNTPSLLEQTEGLSDYIQDFTQMRKEETGKEFGSVETYEPVSRQTPVGRLQNNMEENESQDAFSFTQPVQAFESVYTQQEAEQAIKNLSNINTLYEQIRKNTIEGGAYVPTTGSYSLTDEQRKEIEQATKELESIISSNTSSAIEKEAAQQYVNIFEEITGKGNYAKLALSQFAQGVPSTIRNTATGISNMIGDIASGGRLSESTKKLDKYFSENPNLLQEIAQGKPVYTPAIAEETGVRQNDLDQYLATAQDRAMQERNYAEYGKNLNQGRAEFIGSNAYSLGAQIPGLLLTSGANSVSPMWKKTVEQAKELGYLIDAKTGNVLKNLKDVTGGLLGNLADGKSLKTALKSAFQGNFATYLIGVSAAGGQYNELMRTEDYDVRNFLNAFGQGFAEYFTEGLFGFSDMASFERFFDSSIGNGTTRFLKGLLNWLSGGGEEGLEEIVNAPLGELINFATGKKEDMKNAVMSWNPEFSTGGFQGIRAIIGENGIFNLEDMMVGGLGGFVTGAILGMAGSVASTYDSMKEGKDISKTVKTLNRFAQEELPDVFRPQMLDPNTASRKDVAAYTVQIQNAIADYAGELKNQMEAAEMQAEADARRSVESSAAQAVLENNAENIPGMLPTAAQAEERARLRQDATELERSGIAAGVSDEDMQTARRLSDVLGREIRFYDGNNREGTEAVANGYYDRNTIYVNSRSQNPVAQIISHELTHSLESAKAYGELSNMILGELERTGEDLSRMRAEKKNLYARNGVMLSNENANREIVAEYVEKNLLSNETKILELTRKNRTLAQRISGWIQSTLAKLGNKKSQERVFLERANRLYAKALRQTQNETRQRIPQEAQSTMQNRTQESTDAQLTEVQKYREASRDAEQTVRRTEEPERYETRNAAPTERVNPEGMRELQEAYAAGQITDEEFDDAIDALMEEEGLLDRDMLDAQYSISLGGYTPDIQVSSDGILTYFGIDNLNRKYDVINKVAAKLPYLSTEQQRKPIVNIDTGLEIEIWKSGIEETFGNDNYFKNRSQRYKKAKLAIMPQLAKLIKYGEVRAPESGNYHNPKSGVRYAYLSAPATVDGESYTVTMDIRRLQNGENRFYIHNLKINKTADASFAPTNGKKQLFEEASAISNTTIPQQSTGVNPSIRESVETDTSDQYMQEDGEKYTPQYSMDENERATGYDDRGERWDGTMMEIGKDQTEREAEEARRIQNAEYQNYPWLYGTGETVSEAIQEGERTQTPGMLPKAEADPVENLPAKAKRYFTRAERYLIDKMARVLNVPNLAGRESFQTIVREIADEYLQNGTVSGETIARVFNQAYEDSVALNRAYYEEYRELREYFKTLNLTITKEQANDIPDQDAFLQSNRNRIGIRMGEDSNVNEVYAELQRQWPALFQRGSELTEAEKAQKIASVAQSFEMAKRSLNGYYGKNPNEARRWARRDFEAAVQDATGEFQVVRRYMEDRNAEKQEVQIPTTQEEVARLWVLAKTARKNYEKVLARNLLTEHDEIQVGRLLRGEIEPQHLNEAEDNVQGITAVYQAKREYEDIAKVIRAWNQARKAALKQQADGYLETANDWKDKQAGILYARETMERNIRDIVPDEDLADEIIRRYFTPVHDAAAQANRMKNQYRERVKALDLSRDIAEGNLVSEAHAVQLLGEAEDNIRMMTQSRGLIRERDGKTLEEWRGVVKKLWEENPNLDAGKIRSAVEDFRKIYDELFQMMNETRIRNGYEPVNYRNGYFPHFQPGDGDGILARFGKAMGVTTDVTALPTTINGLTHTFRPGIQWFGNAQERLGFNTVYDAVEGFDKYIEGVSDVIFQTDNIQRLRALATQIRYRTGDEGIRKQIDDVLTNPNLTEEEKQDRISRIYESGRYALSNFVAELDEYTNLLANKKSRSDRGMERAIGRRAYNVMKALEQRLGANMVAINPGSWLTNFIPLVQGNAMLDRGMLLRGMWDTLKAYRSDDGIVNQSSFLTNRRGSDPIVKSYEQGERAAGGAKKVGQTIGKAFGKSGEILASPMEFIDYFVADSLVRARYRQNLGKGMSEDAAMEDADAFAAGVMADRSKGAMPTLFYSRNPMVKLFTQFQLEVNNQISYILKDIPREKRKNSGRSITAMLLKFFLGSWLFNEIFEFTIGRRPTLDPIGILNDTAGDLTGWELPNLVELGLGAVSGNMPSFQTEQVGLYDAGINMFENAAEQMPFIGGLLGGGRLPISSAIPDFATAWNALTNDEWSSEKRWQEIRDEVLEKPVTYLALPFGGGQLKKIYEGIEGILEGGSYVVNAEGERQLQYPIYADTTGEAIGNAVRATLFGRTSLPTGQEWIESGFGMLSADQTAVYEGMLEAGISGREAYELIESMRQAEKTDTESKADQQRRILEESGISGEGKSIAYYGMLASDRERELMTSLNDDFTDMGEVTDVLLAIKDAGNLTGAAASNAKRDAILESGLSESDKKEIYRYTFGERQENGTYMSSRDEDIQAFENAGLSFDEFLEAQNEYSTINEQYDRAGDKALEFSRWVDEQPYADKQKDVIKESFRYFSQVPTDAGRYETFQEAGLSTESAYELTEILNGLEPEEGKEQVSNYQRYTAILESSLGEREKLDAIGAIMGTEMETESGNPTQYARLLSAMDEGVNLKDWFGVTQYKSEAKTDYDEYGEEVKSAKEKVVEYIDSLNISEEEKDALYLYGCNYAESGLSDTPWQSGGWSMSDIDWSGIILPMA